LEKLAAEDDSLMVRKAAADVLEPVRQAEELAKKKEEEERLVAQRAEEERIAADKEETEKHAAQKLEAQRMAAEQAEADRLAAEKARAERKRLAEMQAQQEHAARQQAEPARLKDVTAHAASPLLANTGSAASESAAGAVPQPAPRRWVKNAFLLGGGTAFLSMVLLGMLAVSWMGGMTRQFNAQASQTADAAIAAANTRTANANARATLAMQSQLTQSAQATSVAGVRATGTAVVMSTAQARESQITSLRAQATQAYGPAERQLKHNASENYIIAFRPGLYIKNFIAQATFVNPYPTSKGNWDYGFLFRSADFNYQYRIILSSGKQWELENWIGSSNTTSTIASGVVANLNTGENDSNTLWLLASDRQGELYVNGQFIADLDLSARTSPGDVVPATGLYSGDQVSGYATQYKDLIIWRLP
jgi:hypothetical protein